MRLLPALLLAACVSAPAGGPSTAMHWKERIGRLRTGMSRAEVERILPWFDDGAGRGGSGIGGGVVEVYPVSPEWTVSVFYTADGLQGTVGLAATDGSVEYDIAVPERKIPSAARRTGTTPVNDR